MTFPTLQHMPLKSAYLCEDCNSIGNSAVQCPACASHALLDLSAVLDRERFLENDPASVMDVQRREVQCFEQSEQMAA
jgi:hypothetical protein